VYLIASLTANILINNNISKFSWLKFNPIVTQKGTQWLQSNLPATNIKGFIRLSLILILSA